MTILVYVFLVPALGAILLLANWLLAPSISYAQKASAYECGFTPLAGQTRAPFSVAFYLVGLLFLIFDLEVLLLIPFAQSRSLIDPFGLSITIIFILVLVVGFAFEVSSGAIKFTESKAR